jgi:cytoskeletal protein CcmA (bactofilin family)
MGRSPFAATPPTPQPAPSMPLPPRPAAAPAPAMGPAPAAVSPRRELTERRTLVVGRGISLQGVVQDAERLVVEGTVEATMIHATELSVSPGGVFKGEVEVEDAEVAGTIDGTLTARGNLNVRATGRVLGTARCRRLQVEDGGQITGRIEMLTESARGPEQMRSDAAD